MIQVLKSYRPVGSKESRESGSVGEGVQAGVCGHRSQTGDHASRVCTYVAPKLSYYDMIHSCGLKGVTIVSLSSLLRRAIQWKK